MSQTIDQTELYLARTEKALDRLMEVLKLAHQEGWSLDNVERSVFSELLNLGHAALGDFIQAAGNGDVGEELAVGERVVRRSEEKHKRSYHSIFGNFEIERYTYSLRKKTKAIVKPLDQRLGLPADETSYVLEDWMCSLSVDLPFGTAAEWLSSTLGIDVPASLAQRRVGRLGGYVEGFNEQRPSVSLEDEQDILVALSDGKGVPIRTSFEQRAHDELGIRLPRRPQPKKAYPKSDRCIGAGGQKTQRATAGAFYSIAPNKRTLERVLDHGSSSDAPVTNKRMWVEMNLIGEEEVSRGAERVFQSLASEYAQRDPEKRKRLVCLMDGDRHQWALQEKYLPEAIPILDLFHVMEKLWTAANCFHRETSPEAEQWVQRHLRMLLENHVDAVRGLLKREINRQTLSAAKLKDLEKVYTYFTVNRQRMRYGDYLNAGYPIGSGVIEGACKHLVGDRMCGTGMRWELEGAQPMLDLRVTKINGDWNAMIAYRIRKEQEELYGTAA